MKKAKVIIPSLALLSFSALACVTGSVAWFSSVTSAKVSTSQFEVRALVGQMNISVFHGCGTRATYTGTDAAQHEIKNGTEVIGYKNSDKIIVAPGQTTGDTPTTYVLSHGSYDPNNQAAYTWKAGAVSKVGQHPAQPQTKAGESNYYEQGTAGVFNIFTWKMYFDYDFGGAAQGLINLYIDGSQGATQFSKEGTIQAGTPDTARGFRMFILTMSNDTDAATVTKWTCISPYQAATLDQNLNAGAEINSYYLTYDSTKSELVKTDYVTTLAGGNLIYSANRNGELDIANQKVDGSGIYNRKDCVGQFNAANLVKNDENKDVARVILKVVCVYEGEDKNVEFGNVLNKVGSILQFYVADNKA